MSEEDKLRESAYDYYCELSKLGIAKFFSDVDRELRTGEAPLLGDSLRDMPMFARRVYTELSDTWRHSRVFQLTEAVRSTEQLPPTIWSEGERKFEEEKYNEMTATVQQAVDLWQAETKAMIGRAAAIFWLGLGMIGGAALLGVYFYAS